MTDGHSTDDLDVETLADISRWLDSSPTRGPVNVRIPKFKTTVPSALEQLLPAMGMSNAFGTNADFSDIVEGGGIHINKVQHKAFIELTEQGTEAAAATSVGFLICFAAGTPVLTPDGNRPIEQIRPGDMVLSRDEHNVHGPIEAMEVEEVFHRRGSLLELQIGDQIIRATPEHRIHVRNQGWTKARDLSPGEQLASDLSSWLPLQQITACEGEHPVYNFRVVRSHTYFIGGA